MDKFEKYFEGSLNKKDSELLADEIKSSENRRDNFIVRSKLQDVVNIADGESRKANAKSRLNKIIKEDSESKSFKFTMIYRVAALLIMFVAVSYFMTVYFSNKYEDYVSVSTEKGKTKRLYLPDGTLVVLNSASELKYSSDFRSQRHVVLNGEAFFDVKKNKSLFWVSADGMNIKVLGTAFNVSNYSYNKDITTTLFRGRVNVSGYEKSFNIIPGEQITLTKKDKSFRKSEVDVSRYNSWIDGVHKFSDESLDELAKRIERVYNVKIELEPDIKSLVFSGSFSENDSLNDVLRFIKLSSNRPIIYSVESDKVRISLK